GKGYVFTGGAGPISSLKKSFNKALAEAGIERHNGEGRLTWHSLRHAFGSRLGEAGVDANTLRELMGHASLHVTVRYLKSAKERKRAAVDALA
ncbi:MAG: tyrosine-type recombinase/integrase, partial [Hyphomicrobium sp.]